jgi:serine/threonine protein kinase
VNSEGRVGYPFMPVMPELPPNSATGTSAEPAAAPPPSLSVEGLFASAADSTDDAPTIISKVLPTQAFVPPTAAESALHDSVRGRTLAHFELLEPIGVGGMAAVIRARDLQLDRLVALKILPPEMAADLENVKRFHQEARAAAKLDHENIARVYFCGEDQKLHFIAFEFVEGQNLRTLLERNGRLPVKEAVHYLLQIATGLAHAAARGVVHRDIKPSNIIVTPTGRAKLVDMGLARSLAPHDNRQLTQSGVTLGTFDYISPEQALEPRDADVRSDIYSLGCTFYHMLTGQPPVPEGTAAKKLHHHQHVGPIDPRQLNPEIPDEVAAILQRMMAKDPTDRYQGAEHLVQHLIQVAQKVGGADVPEGLLFVDAPLPNPPRKRPVLLLTLAALALAVLGVVVALTPPSRSPWTSPLRSKPLVQNTKDEVPAKDPGQPKVKETRPLPETRKVANESELAEALAEDRSLKIILTKDLRFTGGELIYHGSSKRTLEVISENPADPVVVQFVYPADKQNLEDQAPFWAGLTVDGGQVKFQNIRFEVESGQTPRLLAAGVVVKAGQATFQRCTFAQRTPADNLIASRDVVPMASAAAWNPATGSGAADRVLLVFNQCYFPGGQPASQAAVSVKGSARIEEVNCAFGPHACLHHVWGQDKDDKAEFFLSNVAAHVVHGPVFRLDDNVSCDLAVQYSLFSCPSNASSRDRPDLIRQTGPVRNVVYKGKRNAYHDLLALWKGPGKEDQDNDLTRFQKRIAPAGADTFSAQLKVSPWASPNPLGEDRPEQAFKIDARLPELRRLEKDEKQHPIGVEICTWGKTFPNDLPILEPERPKDILVQLKPGERLVDPSDTVNGARVYRKVSSAITEADPGDVILIKHNGELPVEPTALTDKANVKIRPYGNSKPILVLGKTAEKDTALFHLHHGHIELEQLEILLRPDGDHRRLAVACLGGNGECHLTQCVVTLDAGDNTDVELDVVKLPDPRDAMKMPMSEPRPQPRIHLAGSFIRGKGNLVNVRASRAFDLDVEMSLLCLEGRLLASRSSSSDMMPMEVKAQIKLTRITTNLTDPLLYFDGSVKNGRGLLFTQVQATGCLFVSASGKPLVRFEGLDGEDQMKKLLSWTGGANMYAGFDKLLDQPGNTAATTVKYYADQWRQFTEAGADTQFVPGLFQPAPGMERVFVQVTPQQFRLKSEPSVFGVVIDQLPIPSGEIHEQENPPEELNGESDR